MRKFLGFMALAALTIAALPGANASADAGPGPHGVTSDNVEHVTFLPFEAGTATGANFFSKGKDDYMIITGWKTFSIYNINNPEAPEIVGQPVPFGFKFENEDVATDGNIMLFSESLPQNVLHIWNIEDVSNPVEIASVPGAGNHTTSCILKCKWSWGSNGTIVDLRNPAKPKLIEGKKWGDNATPPNSNGHDVTEVAPGIIQTSTNPIMILDARKDPTSPKVLAVAPPTHEGFVHSNLWPRKMKDKFSISGGETCCGGEQCGPETSAGITIWDTTGWQKTHTFKQTDRYTAPNGTILDGGTVANAPFGCSSHWFETHPTWKNGGLLAAGWYASGTRFLDVDSKGKIEQVGFFLPNGGSTSGAYWITDEIVYSVDYARGVDVLRWTGDF
jgi:hypothetical protein